MIRGQRGTGTKVATTGTERRNDASLQGDDEITSEEVKNVVACVKNGKAPCLKGIQIELIKHGQEALFNLLAYFFNSFSENRMFWKYGHYIGNIYKKKKPSTRLF